MDAGIGKSLIPQANVECLNRVRNAARIQAAQLLQFGRFQLTSFHYGSYTAAWPPQFGDDSMRSWFNLSLELWESAGLIPCT